MLRKFSNTQDMDRGDLARFYHRNGMELHGVGSLKLLGLSHSLFL
jgi:predicted RNA-binding protein with PUA-like domain